MILNLNLDFDLVVVFLFFDFVMVGLLFLLVAISGFCADACETVAALLDAVTISSTTMSVSNTIAAFLNTVAIGSVVNAVATFLDTIAAVSSVAKTVAVFLDAVAAIATVRSALAIAIGLFGNDWLVLDDFHNLDGLVAATAVSFVFVTVMSGALLLSIAATAAVFEFEGAASIKGATSIKRAAFLVSMAVSIDGWVDCASSRAAFYLNLGNLGGGLQARFLVDHAVSAKTNSGKLGLVFPGHSGGHEASNDGALVHC